METVRLTPHSRLRRLVKTSRLRLTGSAFQSLSPGPLRENAASECRDRACTGMTERKAFLQLVEGEHSFLGTVVVELLVLELQVFQLFAEHQTRCEAGHLRVTDLGDQRHGTGSTRVGFEDEHLAVFDSVLHVHEAAHVEGFSDLARVILDGGEVLTPLASAAALGHAEMRAFRRDTRLHAIP